jgi:hypothetical protein
VLFTEKHADFRESKLQALPGEFANNCWTNVCGSGTEGIRFRRRSRLSFVIGASFEEKPNALHE